MKLIVWLHGTHAGTLRRGRGGRWEFRFEPAFLARGDQPVLGRWFEDRDKADLILWHPQTLPHFFENYLPTPGSALRELLARRAGVAPSRSHALLAALGTDLPGAVSIQAVGDEEEPDPDAPPERRALPVPGDQTLRFSLAGIQLKFSVLREAHGFTMPASGLGGRWIAKLPDRMHPGLPSHEYAMYALARAVGINVPECHLVTVDQIAALPEGLDLAENEAFIVQRYDRDDRGGVTHQEDFAQVLDRSPEDKYNEFQSSELRASYDSIGQIVRGVCGPEDFAEYVRRLVFTVLIGNGDAHLKNWSLVYPDRRRARLSPAYDLVATVAYQASGRADDLALKLFRKRAFADIQLSDFEKLARLCGDDPAATRSVASQTVAAFHAAWQHVAPTLSLNETARAAMARHLKTLALAR